MKENLIKTVKSLALFIVLLVIADRGVGYLIEKLYYQQKRGDLFQTTYAIKQAKQDVLIFGASRAMHNYVSDILEQKLHMSTYNLGRDGRNMLYNYAVFSQILTYHRPDVIIMDVQPTEYSWKAGKAGEDAMIYALLPYADNPEITSNISKIRKSDIVLTKLFKTYAYNSCIAQILGYNYGFMTDSKNIKGYEPLAGCKLTKSEFDRPDKQSLKGCDTEIVDNFKAFLSLAKKNNVKVYITVSPTAYDIGTQNCIADLKRTTEQYGFYFYDYSKDPLFNNYTLYYDKAHLNAKGANIFTQHLADELTKKTNITNRFVNRE